MYSLMRQLCFANVLITAVVATPNLEARAGCADNYSKCNPKGVSSSADTPAVGADLSPLYVDVVNSVNGVGKAKRDAHEGRDELAFLLETRASSSSLCCKSRVATFPDLSQHVLGVDGTLCLLLQGLSLPFCYVSR